MEQEAQKKPVLRLGNTVVRRVVPMTSSGCDALRALRRCYQKEILETKGVDVDIPYPTVIHMALNDLCELKGVVVEDGQEDADRS